MKVAAVILAAGGSTRFGSPKLLHPFHGHPLIRHVAEIATSSRADSTLVVLGSDADQLRPHLWGLNVMIMENPLWRSGLSSSIQAALRTLPASADGVMLMLADQPLVTAGVLNRLIDAFALRTHAIVASSYAGTTGVPAIFSRSVFPELMRLSGDEGAKSVIQRGAVEALTIPFPGGELDIDTGEDVLRLDPA